MVIGGGATGVELAGTLAEIARHTLRGEFRRFDPRNARVVLVEGAERVLPAYPPTLSERARLQLERLGVTVWLGRQRHRHRRRRRADRMRSGSPRAP